MAEPSQAQQNKEFAQHFMRRLSSDMYRPQDKFHDLQDVLEEYAVVGEDGKSMDAKETAERLTAGLREILRKDTENPKNVLLADKVEEKLTELFTDNLSTFPSGHAREGEIDFGTMAQKLSDAEFTYEAPDGKGKMVEESGNLHTFLVQMNLSGYNDFAVGYLSEELAMVGALLDSFIPGLGGMFMRFNTVDPSQGPAAEIPVNADFESLGRLMNSATGYSWEKFMSDDPDSMPEDAEYISWHAPNGDHGLLNDFIDGTGQYAGQFKTREDGMSFSANFETAVKRLVDFDSEADFEQLREQVRFVKTGFDMSAEDSEGASHADHLIESLQSAGIFKDPVDPAEMEALKEFLEDGSRFQTGVLINNNTGAAISIYEELKGSLPDGLSRSDAIHKIHMAARDYIKSGSPEDFERRMEEYVKGTDGVSLKADYVQPVDPHVVPGTDGLVHAPVIEESMPEIGEVSASEINLTARVDGGEAFVYSKPVELGTTDFDVFKDTITTYNLGADGVIDVAMSDQELETLLSELDDSTPTLEAVLGEDGVADAFFVSNDDGKGFYITAADLDATELSAVSEFGNLSEPAPDPAAAAPAPSTAPLPAAPSNG